LRSSSNRNTSAGCSRKWLRLGTNWRTKPQLAALFSHL